MVMVDDAHATGVLGEKGGGTVEHFKIRDHEVIQMGTLSKALGSLGGFVAGSHTLIEFLVNEARSLIYSTALPPAALASAIASLEILETTPGLLRDFWRKINFFKKELLAIGYDLMGTETHILPILVGESDLAVSFSKALYEEGVYVPAIRPPTVPKGTSRLRLTLMATHTDEDLEQALEVLRRAGRKFGILH